MRQAIYARFGPATVLSVEDRPEPRLRPSEVLVHVHAAALNPKDVLVRKGRFRWLSGTHFPRGTGYDWAGEVIAIGPEVTQAHPGDLLYGMANGWLGSTVAERFVAREDECAPLPLGLSFVDAAALPLAALTALQALRDVGRLAPKQRVLLLGASGGVGVHAIQIARALGAHVTATASEGNLDLLRELGAHEAIDYRTTDALATGTYDLIVDVFGNRRFEHAEPALAEGGRFVSTIPSVAILLARLRTLGRQRTAHLVVVRSRRSDLVELGEMCAAGVLRPIIDRVFDIDDIVAAHERVETKRARGKVVVAIPPRAVDA